MNCKDDMNELINDFAQNISFENALNVKEQKLNYLKTRGLIE